MEAKKLQIGAQRKRRQGRAHSFRSAFFPNHAKAISSLPTSLLLKLFEPVYNFSVPAKMTNSRFCVRKARGDDFLSAKTRQRRTQNHRAHHTAEPWFFLAHRHPMNHFVSPQSPQHCLLAVRCCFLLRSVSCPPPVLKRLSEPSTQQTSCLCPRDCPLYSLRLRFACTSPTGPMIRWIDHVNTWKSTGYHHRHEKDAIRGLPWTSPCAAWKPFSWR